MPMVGAKCTAAVSSTSIIINRGHKVHSGGGGVIQRLLLNQKELGLTGRQLRQM